MKETKEQQTGGVALIEENGESSHRAIDFEIVPADAGIAEPAKHTLVEAFQGFFAKAEQWRAQTENITDAKLARAARLELKKIRVEAERTRKALKEDALRMGRAIDGANNILLSLIVPIEKRMEDVEKQEERRAAAELARLTEERSEHLRPYVDEGMPFPDVGKMTAEQFDKALADAKLLHAAKIAEAKRIEEERIAKEKAEAEERERIRQENERLKAEAAAKEAELKAEREAAAKREAEAEAKRKAEREAEERARAEASAKADAERKAAEEAARREREAVEAKAKAEREALEAKLKAEQEAKEKAEREAKAAREKAEAEARAKAEEEAKEKARLAEQARKAASAPDREKILSFAEHVRGLKLPEMATPEGEAAAKEIAKKVRSFAKWIGEQAP